MNELRYTLVADGSSDRRLIPVLTWLLQRHSSRDIAATWADFSVVRTPPRDLPARIAASIDLYPADLLFVHRDAEAAPHHQRVNEVHAACGAFAGLVFVPVVPVRMQEAWLLISERAIRTAAGRPRGRVPLGLPPRQGLERDPDPKQTLYNALRTASELTGRHLTRFKVAAAAYRVSELIGDYSALRGVPAFDALEAELQAVLSRHRLT
jgi:hypothetical protein